MWARSVDFGGASAANAKEDRKALLERLRLERAARADGAALAVKAAVAQRCARRFVARARALTAVRTAFDALWTELTNTRNRRAAALVDNPMLEQTLFPAESDMLARLVQLLALLARRPLSTRPRHQNIDDVRLLQLSAAIFKAAMDRAPGAERHSFFCPDLASHASAPSPRLHSEHWVRGCTALVSLLFTRLRRELDPQGAPKEAKCFAVLASALATALDPVRWSAAAGALSPPMLGSFRELMRSLITRQRLWTQLRHMLDRLCFAPALATAAASSSSAAASSSSSLSASSTMRKGRAAAAAPPPMPTRPQAFIGTLLIAAFRLVEIGCGLTADGRTVISSVQHRAPDASHRRAVNTSPTSTSSVPSNSLLRPASPEPPMRCLMPELGALFVTHILTLPALPSFLPALLTTALTRMPTAAAPFTLYPLIYSVLHQLLLPADFQEQDDSSTFLHSPFVLTDRQWDGVQPLLPPWAQYDSLHCRPGAPRYQPADVHFHLPAQAHLLSTLFWLTLHFPLPSLSPPELHQFVRVVAELLPRLPAALLLSIGDQGRLELDSLEDEESVARQFGGTHAVDQSLQACAVRGSMLPNFELLFRQTTLAAALNIIFTEGHSIAVRADDRMHDVSDQQFEQALKSYALIDAVPSQNDLFVRAFRAFSHAQPAYFGSVLLLFTRMQTFRAATASSSSRILRSAGLSWLSFSSPFLLCLWETLTSRIGVPLDEQGRIEQQPGGAGAAPAAASSSTSATDALRSFFGFKSSSSASSPGGSVQVFVSNRNRWELAILTSRNPRAWISRGDGSSSSSASAGDGVSVTDLFLLWLSFFSPLLFILEDGELLSRTPGLSPPGDVATVVALVHLLKMLIFRIIWHRYEPLVAAARGTPSPREPVLLYERYADLLLPAQRVLRELYQRDVRRSFMSSVSPKAQLKEAERKKKSAAAPAASSSTSYAALFPMEMDVFGPINPDYSAPPRPSPPPVSPPASNVDEDPAAVEQHAFHWTLESLSGGDAASRDEMAGFQRDFEQWSRGALAVDRAEDEDGQVPADLSAAVDPSAPHAQRLFHLLRDLPFLLPFSRRASLLRAALRAEAAHYGYRQSIHGPQSLPAFEVTVRRSHLLEDGLSALSRLGRNFKHRCRIVFLDSASSAAAPGQLEAERGIDLGGPSKEFVELLLKDLFTPDFGLWASTDNATGPRLYYPNPLSPMLHEEYAELYRNAGRLVGKALFEGILLELPLASFFLHRIIGQGAVLGDLEEMDPQLYKNLILVKNYPPPAADGSGGVADLALTMTVDQSALGTSSSVELVPGGANIDVVESNKTLYVYRLAHYHLVRKLAPVVEPFLAGLSEIVPLSSFKMFNASEIRMVLSGASHGGIDVADWRAHTVYEGCTANTQVVKWFFEIIASSSFSHADRSALLKFCTSCSRPPLQGFRELQPPFTLRVIPVVEAAPTPSAAKTSFFKRLFSSQPNQAQLPTAATCFNTLKLPKYSSKSVLEEKLRTAISNNVGFHLT